MKGLTFYKDMDIETFASIQYMFFKLKNRRKSYIFYRLSMVDGLTKHPLVSGKRRLWQFAANEIFLMYCRIKAINRGWKELETTLLSKEG